MFATRSNIVSRLPLPGSGGARLRSASPVRASGCRHRTLRLHSMNFFGFLFGGGKKPATAVQTSSSGRKGWAPRTEDTPQKISRSGYDITPLSAEERQAAAQGLTDFQRYVVLEHGTERAFTGRTTNGFSHDNKRSGLYVSALGGLPLFSSGTKFDSGTGWPSFYAPLDPEHVVEVVDLSLPYMPRVEVLDARSGAHLGHVFDDGPPPTGKRYCINAAALKFIPDGQAVPPESRPLLRE